VERSSAKDYFEILARFYSHIEGQAMPLKIEPVNRSPDRRSFNCVKVDLNHFA
jgi:hypothetical protein